MKALSEVPIAYAMHIYETRLGFKIKTNQDFYAKVEINSKRFGLLLKGRLVPTVDELKRVAAVFDIPITDLL